MSILIDENSRIVVQGITGRYGRRQVEIMLQSETNIVAGVSPGKGGEKVHDIPVYHVVSEAVNEHNCDTSIIYVPPYGVKEAAIEAIDHGIKTIMIATEDVPVFDTMYIREYAEKHGCWIIGPNTAGMINPEQILLGSIAPEFTMKGHVGVIAQSGSIVNEVSRMLTNHKIGQSSCIDIGGDLVIGKNMKDYLALFEADPETKAIVLVGEIGGKQEYEAGEFIKKMTKPVFAYIVGKHVPSGKQIGHVGALILEESETADAKASFLQSCGAYVAQTIWELPDLIKQFSKMNEGVS